MEICVCGWYGLESFYKELMRCDRTATVVCNRRIDVPKVFQSILRENIGLEFGAYNEFLMNLWKGGTDVLFMHDDIEFGAPFCSIVELIEPYAEKMDHAWIFGSPEEAYWNDMEHGRMFFMSQRLLEWWKVQGGFFYDKLNNGHTGGTPHPKAMHYNAGIKINSFIMRGINLITNQVLYVRDLKPMYRGSGDVPWEVKNGT